jgi:hypothetical protein
LRPFQSRRHGAGIIARPIGTIASGCVAGRIDTRLPQAVAGAFDQLRNLRFEIGCFGNLRHAPPIDLLF